MTESVVGGQAGEAVGIDPNAVYLLGRSVGESERLERQANELAPESEVVIDRVGLRGGDSAIDLGCGPAGVLELLHRRVSPGGRVVGLDSDPAHVEMAAAFVSRRGLDGVEVEVADARSTGLPADSFDLVHARMLLINVPDPGAVVAEMVRLAKPGGWVAGLEPEPEPGFCYPPHPALDRIDELFFAVGARTGADRQVGRKMAGHYRDAGLEDVAVEARATVYSIGHSRRTIRVDLLRAVRRQILELGLAHEPELDELDATARAHLQNADVVVMPYLHVLAWGRKPTLI